MPRISVNGVQLYYEWHGPEEAEVLVLSNGILMSTASWALQIPALARHYRLLLYDCRGMWQSDHPPGPYSMAQHTDDLAGLLDGLGVEAAHIGGTSYGAEISMVFALKYPGKTRSLIVTSAVSQVDPLLEGMIGSWILAARAKDPKMFFQAVYPLTFSEPWIAANQAILADARERYKQIDYEAMLELLLSFSQLDITAELDQIEAPTLVVVGEDDLLKPRPYAELIAAKIPAAEFALIPHAGHAALWEQAEIFNSLLLGFLVKQPGPVQLDGG